MDTKINDLPVTDQDREDITRLANKEVPVVTSEEAKETEEDTPPPPDFPEESSALPEWFKPIPSKMKLPKGRLVIPILFPAELTDAPEKGDRQCLLWGLSDREQSLAYERTTGKASRALPELAKGMIRIIDGVAARWDSNTGAGSIKEFWEDIGPKGRQLVQECYSHLHTLGADERKRFFERCITVVRVT